MTLDEAIDAYFSQSIGDASDLYVQQSLVGRMIVASELQKALRATSEVLGESESSRQFTHWREVAKQNASLPVYQLTRFFKTQKEMAKWIVLKADSDRFSTYQNPQLMQSYLHHFVHGNRYPPLKFDLLCAELIQDLLKSGKKPFYSNSDPTRYIGEV